MGSLVQERDRHTGESPVKVLKDDEDDMSKGWELGEEKAQGGIS